jgi:hypothetical protein
VTNDRLHTIPITRRRTLRALTLVAAGGAACRKSDPDSGLSIEALHNVSKVHGSRLTGERLEEIRPSIEQQLARLEAVRGFDLDEGVEPATVFLAKHAPEPTNASLRRIRG